MSDYTPTTEEIRQGYSAFCGRDVAASLGYFDRWFASEIEKAELRGAVKVSRAMLEDALAKSDHEFGEFL